jgi:AraC family transcriptional regulator
VDTAVERAINFMCDQYSEPLSLADVAASAILSRFHFSRLFRSTTGVTPGRFLSAVRIYQAKRMLLTTGMKITDIAFAVGYNSLGSFSNHFTASVSVSPGRYRRIMQNGGFQPPAMRRPEVAAGTLSGQLRFPREFARARFYIGAFDSPIVQRCPASATMIEVGHGGEPVGYALRGVPPGSWFIHAVAVADSADPEPWTRRVLLIGGAGEVLVSAGADTQAPVDVRPRRPTDLPILLALPNLSFEPEASGTRRHEVGSHVLAAAIGRGSAAPPRLSRAAR